MADTYYAPDGNAEVWEAKPEGYLTVAEWLKLHPLPEPDPPTLEEAKDATLSQLATKTNTTILNGFEHEINGIKYHFSYDEEDQGNFAKANSAALLALITNDSGYAQVWRGWRGDKPHVFHLSIEEYLALSRAGADHQLWWQQRYWQKEAAIKAASSFDELNAIII